MTSNRPDPDRRTDDGAPDGSPDLAFGRFYGRAPRTGGSGGPGSGLRAVYTFILVWFSTALIMWFGTRLFGFERGDLGAAIVSLVVSLVAAIAITTWARKRGR